MPGIGTGGGLKLYVQDRAGHGLPALEQATWIVAGWRRKTRVRSGIHAVHTHTPQIYADIDRTKAELLRVPIDRVFQALSVYMGSEYINDFNLLGRTYQVSAQADNQFRLSKRCREPEDATTRRHGADRFRGDLPRHDGAVPRAARTVPGCRSATGLGARVLHGQAIAAIEMIAKQRLPQGFGSNGRRSRCRRSSPATRR